MPQPSPRAGPPRTRCPDCHGVGRLCWWLCRADDGPVPLPCPACNGAGSLPFGAPPLSDEAALYRHEVHEDDGEAD